MKIFARVPFVLYSTGELPQQKLHTYICWNSVTINYFRTLYQVALISFLPLSSCVYHIVITGPRKLKKYEVGVASKGLTFMPNFMWICQLVQNSRWNIFVLW